MFVLKVERRSFVQVKSLLRFYFGVDKLEEFMDREAYRQAFSGRDAFACADRIVQVIACKCALGELWRYLDGVIGGMTEREKEVLKSYALRHGGIACLPEEQFKEYRRVVIKFGRHCRNLKRFSEGLQSLKNYAGIL